MRSYFGRENKQTKRMPGGAGVTGPEWGGGPFLHATPPLSRDPTRTIQLLYLLYLAGLDKNCCVWCVHYRRSHLTLPVDPPPLNFPCGACPGSYSPGNRNLRPPPLSPVPAALSSTPLSLSSPGILWNRHPICPDHGLPPSQLELQQLHLPFLYTVPPKEKPSPPNPIHNPNPSNV